MWRHIERDNLILYTELVELRRSVAAVAIKDKQLVGLYYTSLYILVGVLYPLKAKFISYPAIITKYDNPAR